MVEKLRCPNGHEWEPDGEPPESAGSTVPRCPRCGEPGAFTSEVGAAELSTRVLDPRLRQPALSMSPARKEYPEIAGYEILDELGRGGMGVVYRARQVKLNRTVALKMVLAGEHASERSRARFLGEAEIAAGLQHANIIQIHELGEDDGLPFISMEYVGGGGMREWMETHRGNYPAIARFFEKLARAAEWAHQRSVVHRDLKPANVFLAEDGEPKIGDFGLAKRLDTDGGGPQLTLSGEKMGTPHYMAPEQAYDEFGPVGPGTDVYALGVMLYEALTGRVPLTGTTEEEMLRRLRLDDPTSPIHYAPGMARDLETVCMKCLRKRPDERYLTAGAFADDLRRFRNGEAVLAKPLTAVTRSFRWVRRHRTGLALTTLVATFAAAAAAWAIHGFLYVWEHAAAYEDFTKRHGQYEGIGEKLSENDLAHRFLSYRIVRAGRKGKTLRLECVDSKGEVTPSTAVAQLVPEILKGLPAFMQPAVYALSYNKEDLPAEERLFDAAGRLVARVRYAYPENYPPGGAAGIPVRGDYIDEESRPIATPSGISSVILVRDTLGREAKLGYSDQELRMKSDENGVAIRRLEYDDTNEDRLRSITNLDTDERVINSKEGWATLRVERREDGPRTSYEFRFFDAAGNPVSSDGVHRVRNELDTHGNLVAVSRFGLDGTTPARSSSTGGATREKLTYDARARRTAWEFSGLDPEKWGVTRQTDSYAWNEDGSHTVTSRYEDADGKPARVHGQLLTLTGHRDRFGKPLDMLRDGYPPSIYPYSREFETKETAPNGSTARRVIAYQSKGGGIAFHTQGNSFRTEESDRYGRVERVILSGMDPTRETYDRAVIETEWPSRNDDSTVYWNFSDSAGGGQAVVQASPSDRDRPAGGSPRSSSWTASQRERVAFGDREEFALAQSCRYLDSDGRPVRCRAGNEAWNREFDVQGRPIRENQTGYNMDETGYATAHIDYHYTRDEDSTATSAEWSYLGADGAPARHPRGYFRYVEEYNARGNAVVMSESGYDEAIKGYFTKRWSYDEDESGHVESGSVTYADAEGEPVHHRDGHLRLVTEYDEKDRNIAERYYGFEPADHAFYSWRIAHHYDEGGRIERKTYTYYDAEGNRVPSDSGYLDRVDTFDEEGRAVSIREWGFDPAEFPYAVELQTIEWSPDGKRLSDTMTYFDPSDAPARHPDGHHRYRKSYNDSGETIAKVKSGFDTLTNGFDTEILDITYWPNGSFRSRHWHYQFADGSPARYPDGYTDFIQEDDEDGSVLGVVESGFDETAYPFFLRRRTYTPHPDIPEAVVSTQIYEHKDGSRARGQLGERESIQHRKPDRMLRIERNGADEKEYGFSRAVTTFDEGGKVASVSFTDAAGIPVTGARARVTRVEPGSAAEKLGLRSGDYLLSLNSVPLESADHFQFNRPRDKGGDMLIQRDGKRLTLKQVPPGTLGVELENRVP